MANLRDNKQNLENRLTSRKAERHIITYVNRWMATERNSFMPRTQSDLVMADFNRISQTITPANLETVVAGFSAWRVIESSGLEIMSPGVSAGIDAGTQLSFSMVGFVPDPLDPLKRKAALAVKDLASRLVVEITDNTREAINLILEDGIRKGKGLNEIGRNLRPRIGLNSRQMRASANFEEKLLTRGDLSPKQIRDRVGVFDRKQHRARARTIARTEGQRVLSEAQIIGFEEANVKTLIWFALVGHDEECAEFQGQEFPIQNTHGLQPLHPNCRCGWLPKPEEARRQLAA